MGQSRRATLCGFALVEPQGCARWGARGGHAHAEACGAGAHGSSRHTHVIVRSKVGCLACQEMGLERCGAQSNSEGRARRVA